MKNLKLLSKKKLTFILLFFFYGFVSYSQEPVDIWNIEVKPKIKEKVKSTNSQEKNGQQNTIYEMQSKKINNLNIEEDQALVSKEIEIAESIGQ